MEGLDLNNMTFESLLNIEDTTYESSEYPELDLLEAVQECADIEIQMLQYEKAETMLEGAKLVKKVEFESGNITEEEYNNSVLAYEGIKEIGGKIKDFLIKIWNGIKNLLEKVFNFFKNLFDRTKPYFEKNKETIKNNLPSILDKKIKLSGKNAIAYEVFGSTNYIKITFEDIPKALDGIINLFKTDFTKWISIGKNIASNATEYASGKGSIKEDLQNSKEKSFNEQDMQTYNVEFDKLKEEFTKIMPKAVNEMTNKMDSSLKEGGTGEYTIKNIVANFNELEWGINNIPNISKNMMTKCNSIYKTGVGYINDIFNTKPIYQKLAKQFLLKFQKMNIAMCRLLICMYPTYGKICRIAVKEGKSE